MKLHHFAEPRPFLRLVRTNAGALEAEAWSDDLDPPAPKRTLASFRAPRNVRRTEPRRCAWTLTCDSWCRVAGGSGETHEITPTETRLLEEGFC